MCEVAIIGSDIQEVVGTSIALNILFGLPIWLGIIITIFDTFLVMSINYLGIRCFEAFFALILVVMCLCFWVSLVQSQPDWGLLVTGLVVPKMDAQTSGALLSLVGSIIMPHNL